MGENIEQQIAMYGNIQMVAGILALVFLAAAVALFFLLHIPDVVGELTGKRAKKEMRMMASGTSESGRIGPATVHPKKKEKEKTRGSGRLNRRRAIEFSDELTGKIGAGQTEAAAPAAYQEAAPSAAGAMPGAAATTVPETSAMKAGETTVMAAGETTVMAAGETTVMASGETTVMNQPEDSAGQTVLISAINPGDEQGTVVLNRSDLPTADFVVERTIMLIHTSEVL